MSCVDLDANTAFFVDDVGFRVDTISPADDPSEIAMSGHGAHIRLRRADADAAGHIGVYIDSEGAVTRPAPLVAPNGTVVEFISPSIAVVVPPNVPTLSLVRASADDAFGAGRAGMGYRDLIPDRWGGRFIASHIQIADGGDVADYVHYHRIRFQMIFVAAGWVDVVYEDQGEPFRMHAGDCVLQPPEIRHRVLRSSAGLEVIEIGCPAVHDTVVEHTIALPTDHVETERLFGGQHFVRHVAAATPTSASVIEGLSERDTGIERATNGLAGARVLGATGPGSHESTWLSHDGEFAFAVVLAGAATLHLAVDGDEVRAEALSSRDSIAIPAGVRWAWSDWSSDFEILDVTLPARTVAPV